ncbi:hypothetical protein P171DRAFT_481256 [Karstenula rhodostoma CBS 690.94]|uniref:Uncharacterized protein n=1 Tax=Karstenula rhodostoma CBS 690.94 TaxID=1392251 RepID=A0A9P4PN35_9PLEO|nr:hypothetical protein P171DRAFT_481256 [Karstenula rhodostoma CBS 690.94]
MSVDVQNHKPIHEFFNKQLLDAKFGATLLDVVREYQPKIEVDAGSKRDWIEEKFKINDPLERSLKKTYPDREFAAIAKISISNNTTNKVTIWGTGSALPQAELETHLKKNRDALQVAINSWLHNNHKLEDGKYLSNDPGWKHYVIETPVTLQTAPPGPSETRITANFSFDIPDLYVTALLERPKHNPDLKKDTVSGISDFPPPQGEDENSG